MYSRIYFKCIYIILIILNGKLTDEKKKTIDNILRKYEKTPNGNSVFK